MTEASDNHETDRALDAPSEPESLGAVSLDSAAFAKTAAELPAARRRSEEGEAPAVEPEPISRRPRRAALRFRLIVGAAVAGCVAILALAAMRSVRSEAPASHAANALMAETPTAPPVAPAAPLPPPLAVVAPVAVPAPSPTPLATAAVAVAAPAPEAPATVDSSDPTRAAKHATIRLARAGQPLTVDGKRSNAPSVVVACGAHTVAVGAEKPRHVDAPCGRTVVVDVGKSTLVKNERAKADGKAHVGHGASPKKH